MRRAVALIEALSGVLGHAGAWVLVPLIVSMIYEVFARHLFGAPTFWAYEVGYMLAGTCYMFGMAYCLKVKGHIRVDFIYERLSPKQRALIDAAGYLVLLLPGGIWLSWGLVEFAIEAYEYNETSGESAWNPVVWPFRTVWAIGIAVLCLQAVAEVVKCAGVLLGVDLGNADEYRKGVV